MHACVRLCNTVAILYFYSVSHGPSWRLYAADAGSLGGSKGETQVRKFPFTSAREGRSTTDEAALKKRRA